MNKKTSKNCPFKAAEIEIVNILLDDIITISRDPFAGEWDEFNEYSEEE